MYIIISDHQNSRKKQSHMTECRKRRKKKPRPCFCQLNFVEDVLEWEGSLYEGGGCQLREGFFFGNISILLPLRPCEQHTKLTKEVDGYMGRRQLGSLYMMRNAFHTWPISLCHCMEISKSVPKLIIICTYILLVKRMDPHLKFVSRTLWVYICGGRIKRRRQHLILKEDKMLKLARLMYRNIYGHQLIKLYVRLDYIYETIREVIDGENWGTLIRVKS